jgi:ABC-type multidrug transport system permease subunit
MYFSWAVRAVTLRGADFLQIWRDVVVLGGFVMVFLHWAVLSFKKRVA